MKKDEKFLFAKNNLIDLHTHTKASDGIHSCEEIVENAIRHKLACIGITDHFDTLKCDSVAIEDLDEYISRLENLKRQYVKFINILTGIELCMAPELSDIGNFPYAKLNKLDYVLLEYIDNIWGVPFSKLCTHTKNLTCKVGLAHTDLFLIMKKYGADLVMEVLKKENIFWELNTSYPYYQYFIENEHSSEYQKFITKLRAYDIEITIGSDTHYLDDFSIDRLKQAHVLRDSIIKII